VFGLECKRRRLQLGDDSKLQQTGGVLGSENWKEVSQQPKHSKRDSIQLSLFFFFFWRYPLNKDTMQKTPFSTIDCLFNHHLFLANCQSNTNVTVCKYDLENPRYWKLASPEALEGIRK
jgi:hypothetical protein